jgi:hypothetical protein
MAEYKKRKRCSYIDDEAEEEKEEGVRMHQKKWSTVEELEQNEMRYHATFTDETLYIPSDGVAQKKLYTRRLQKAWKDEREDVTNTVRKIEKKIAWNKLQESIQQTAKEHRKKKKQKITSYFTKKTTTKFTKYYRYKK